MAGTPPTDLNGDGRYGDVNGDGRLSVADSHALLVHLNTTAVRNNSNAYDFNNDSRVNVGDVQLLYRTVLDLPNNDYDGDGLPDGYERRVTGTDPRDVDSDGGPTHNTTGNVSIEGDNGVLDGGEDPDGDGLTNYFEYRYGTDPFDADTDGDSLPDDIETEIPGVDPTTADTDGDGTTDAADDDDADGLSVRSEYENGTSVRDPDTDNDGLLDGSEVTTYGTDPTDEDTDNDSVTDGEEIALGTDPLAADTDGDGVPDDAETYEVTKSAPNTSVTVTVTGDHTIASGVEVERVPQQDDDTFRRSSVIHVTNRTDIESGTVSFDVPDGLNASEREDLAILKWSPGNRTRWHIVETTVDGGTATTEVENFSYLTLADGPEWLDQLSVAKPTQPRGGGDVNPVDATLVIDTSGSMRGSKIRNARSASREFIDALGPSDQAAVVGFDSGANTRQPLTGDLDAVRSSISGLGAGGGTNIGSGIREARKQHDTDSAGSRDQVMILLSDGQGSGGAIGQAQKAAAEGITINTVAVGNGADEDLLRRIAQETGGEFLTVTDSTDLGDAFSDIGDEVKYQDNDEGTGDGVFDVAERNGIFIPLGPDMGEVVYSDPNVVDTDGDGLDDGEEVRLLDRNDALTATAEEYLPADATDGAWVAIATSNPTKANSDDAGLNDSAELNKGSQPFVEESLFVSFELATTTDQNGDIKTLAGHEGDREVLLAGEYEWGSQSCVVFGHLCSNNPPGWLTNNVDTDDLRDGKTYYRVPVIIRKYHSGPAPDPIDSVSLDLNPFVDGRVVNGNDIELDGKGTRHTMVVETNDNSCLTCTDAETAGNFVLTTDIPSDSVFARDGTNGIELRTRTYGYTTFNEDVAARFAEEGMETWRDATLRALDVYGRFYKFAFEAQSLSQRIAFKLIRTSNKQIRKRIRDGEFDGDFELEKDEGQVHSYTREAVNFQGRTQYFMFKGPAVKREN